MSGEIWPDDTIGVFDWDGTTYQIVWPRELDDETTRCEFAAIYAGDVQVGEACAPLGQRFESADDVMEAAIEVIMTGDVDGGER
ncbi:hypothetical protein M3D15_04670 [Pseudoclavibacter alba]|uniref:Uncharacterized protein n=1 Tax=Pseudoclavibacter albus TaxID=272241 RepID=A0ABT2HWD2_9MICO|nr:hypothetical protein [Pseudoclavibacter alba]MCT2042628.1 hypothetical protein [Pseudoclavibacter alba]